MKIIFKWLGEILLLAGIEESVAKQRHPSTNMVFPFCVFYGLNHLSKDPLDVVLVCSVAVSFFCIKRGDRESFKRSQNIF